MTGSLPLPVVVAERNSVHVTYARPKYGLVGLVSTEIQFLSLKSAALVFVLAITAATVGPQNLRCGGASSSRRPTRSYTRSGWALMCSGIAITSR